MGSFVPRNKLEYATTDPTTRNAVTLALFHTSLISPHTYVLADSPELV